MTHRFGHASRTANKSRGPTGDYPYNPATSGAPQMTELHDRLSELRTRVTKLKDSL